MGGSRRHSSGGGTGGGHRPSCCCTSSHTGRFRGMAAACGSSHRHSSSPAWLDRAGCRGRGGSALHSCGGHRAAACCMWLHMGQLPHHMPAPHTPPARQCLFEKAMTAHDISRVMTSIVSATMSSLGRCLSVLFHAVHASQSAHHYQRQVGHGRYVVTHAVSAAR